ncbi:putative DNA-binding protein [Streptococcus pneumoniae 6963-05]|uniref:hypothetical protein n=1 Tax=Streptococcus pneumoniae TaxID=1313 RepID=UPI0002311214|nr:hypothetical protein [Streptococcus pneumoniae]EHD44716.1 putative DNA-binding protein [Streptococcus pneumoniae GA43265]EHD73153.1 putative DNA-binding protein [Streptococcus pneumoniae 6963-05]
MREVIQELLDSSMSTSAISQGAGVPWTTVSDLRKGKTSMDKMALLTAENFMNLLQLISSDFGHCFYF